MPAITAERPASAKISLNGARHHQGSQSELLACAWLLERGYEVFRNVSAAGPIDIVGIKDGVVSLFDVKTKRVGNGKPITRLSAHQIFLGVLPLYVNDDGTIEIDTDPKPPFTGTNHSFICVECSQSFRPARGFQRYCSKTCSERKLNRNRRKYKRVWAEVSP